MTVEEDKISMDDMHEIARSAIAKMPPETVFSAEDHSAIEQHQDFLLSVGEDLVQGFYNTLYGHEPTARVFHDGERPTREDSLAQWWERTVVGEHDEDYFAWMAMVGLVHVVRGVANPMMLGMASFISENVERHLQESGLPGEESARLARAVKRLMGTVSAVITHGYDRAVESALFEVAGMPQALLRRLRDQSVDAALGDARRNLNR